MVEIVGLTYVLLKSCLQAESHFAGMYRIELIVCTVMCATEQIVHHWYSTGQIQMYPTYLGKAKGVNVTIDFDLF